jgi:hypothetical protein
MVITGPMDMATRTMVGGVEATEVISGRAYPLGSDSVAAAIFGIIGKVIRRIFDFVLFIALTLELRRSNVPCEQGRI